MHRGEAAIHGCTAPSNSDMRPFRNSPLSPGLQAGDIRLRQRGVFCCSRIPAQGCFTVPAILVRLLTAWDYDRPSA